MRKKKVTIIVPVYNSGETLTRCLNSLCKQDYRDLEILLVDNNSTDNSSAICEKYSQNDYRIRVLQEKKQGPSAARNKGILAGTGDILCFVDSDDELICDTAITEIVSAMDGEKMVWFDYVNFEPERKRGRALFFQNHDSLPPISVLEQAEEYDMEVMVPVVWNKAFCYDTIRKSKLLFLEDREYAEDFLFVFQYLTRISRVKFLHKVFYKKWEGCMTAYGEGAYDLIPATLNMMEDIEAILMPGTINEKAYVNIARHLSSKAIVAMVRIHHPKARLSRVQCEKEIDLLLHSDAFHKAFSYYRPKEGQSRVLPFFMRMKWTKMVYVLGKHRAKRAYI